MKKHPDSTLIITLIITAIMIGFISIIGFNLFYALIPSINISVFLVGFTSAFGVLLKLENKKRELV